MNSGDALFVCEKDSFKDFIKNDDKEDEGDKDDKIPWFLEDHFKDKRRIVEPLESHDRETGKKLAEIGNIGGTNGKSQREKNKCPVKQNGINPLGMTIENK
jgi:hypothetical protein